MIEEVDLSKDWRSKSRELRQALLISCLAAGLLGLGGCDWSAKVSQEDGETTVEHVFDVAEGTTFETGVGVQVFVPPADAEGIAELTVVHYSKPDQLDLEVASLESAYDITITGYESHPPVTLTFELPAGMDPRGAVILQYTDEGPVIAGCAEGLLGGTVTEDGLYISITREQLSRYMVAEWLYVNIFRHFDKVPDVPPLEPTFTESEAQQDTQGLWGVDVSVTNPTVLKHLPGPGIGATWYRFRVENVSQDGFVRVDGLWLEPRYLKPGDSKDLTFWFEDRGGRGTIVLDTDVSLTLPVAAASWATRLGSPVKAADVLASVVVHLLTDEKRGWNDLCFAVWEAIKMVAYEIVGSGVQFFINVVPVAVDMATFIMGQSDGRADPRFVVQVDTQKETPPEATLTLYVHEKDAVGPLIVGARIQGSDAAGNSFDEVTNASGYVTITGDPGTWEFTVSKRGYEPREVTVSVAGSWTTWIGLEKELDGLPSGCTVVVQPGEPIQAVIDVASPGDVICLLPGAWEENLVIEKSLTLRAAEIEPQPQAVITSAQEDWPVIRIESEEPIDVTVQGLKITGAFGGCHEEEPDPICAFGISVHGKATATIENNTISGNYEAGIVMLASSQATIEGNAISGNGRGIVMADSSQATIENNTISDNVVGIWMLDSSQATINNNAMSGNEEGIGMRGSSRASIEGNTISGYEGIGMWDSSKATIEGNTISGYEGIVMQHSSKATIDNNTISGNNYDGIGMLGSSQATIIGNVIRDNGGYGVALWERPCFDTDRVFTGYVIGRENTGGGNAAGETCPDELAFLFTEEGSELDRR